MTELNIEVIDNFMQKCVQTIKANPERCRDLLEKSTAYATLLTPKLGYDVVSKAVKEAIREKKTIREVIVAQEYLAEKDFDAIISPKAQNLI